MKKKHVVLALALIACAASAAAFSACGNKHVHSGERLKRGEETHTKICEEFNAQFGEEAHTPADGICTVCGFVVNHTKGLALEYTNVYIDGVATEGYCVKGIGEATDSEIVIPNYYEDLPVIEIGASVFENNTSIVSVSVPDTVINFSLDGKIFKGCTSLERVSLGKTNRLGFETFNGCTALKEAVIPEGVTEILSLTFEKCSSLTRVVLPDSVEVIEYRAFAECSSLSDVEISENASLNSIGNSAFRDCVSLKKITLPENITQIGEGAFSQCTALEKVKLPDSLTVISDVLFYGCTSLADVTLGNAVTEIGISVFEDCASLTKIALPVSIKHISYHVFMDCVKLKRIEYKGTRELWETVQKGEWWDAVGGWNEEEQKVIRDYILSCTDVDVHVI